MIVEVIPTLITPAPPYAEAALNVLDDPTPIVVVVVVSGKALTGGGFGGLLCTNPGRYGLALPSAG